MQPGDPPELLAQAMHIKLVVVAAPDGGVVSPSVDVHCMGQGMIAASSLHHLHRSAEYEAQYRSSMCSRRVVRLLSKLHYFPVVILTSNTLSQFVHMSPIVLSCYLSQLPTGSCKSAMKG